MDNQQTNTVNTMNLTDNSQGTSWQLIGLSSALADLTIDIDKSLSIGRSDSCRTFVRNNLIPTLRKNAKKFELDTSHQMYEAMGLTVLSSMDDLDRQFIEKHPDIAGKSGADLIVILLVGQKIFTVVLGDFK